MSGRNALPAPGDPEYGFRCPKCRAACSMPNTNVIECINPYCDWINCPR